MHIALVEDDLDQQALLSLFLKSSNHTVHAFSYPEELVAQLKLSSFDLIVADWMLGAVSAKQLIEWIRQNIGWKIPIIVITACNDENIVCTALASGADDYVVKPPKLLELRARIAALARRSMTTALSVIRLGVYEIDVQRQRLTLNGTPIELTQMEFDLTVCFFQNPGVLLSRDHLLNKVWGVNAVPDTRTVDTHASRIRSKLQLNTNHGWKLTSIYGYGYRFDRVERLSVET